MRKILKITFTIIFTTLIIIFLVINIIIINALLTIDEFDINKIYQPSNTKIYNKNEELIFELGSKKQTWVSYDEISNNMINALVSIEDQRFFSHKGLDYKRLLGATLKNILNRNYLEGGSTISQQLIKNTMLSSKKTIKRKIQELYFSMKLEEKLTKEQILEAYLNNILFGNQIYGIEHASLYYFNKNASDLNVLEASMLAGIIQLPNYYNPYKNYEEGKERRNLVLKMMYENEFISYIEYKEYIKKEIELDDSYKESNYDNEYLNPYIDYVIYECIKDYNINPYRGDLKIITNIDTKMQKAIYEIMNNNSKIFPDQLLKSGIVLIDNNTGEIEGIGGSRDFKLGDINYSYQVKLQPASAIKPLLDYGPAFEYLNLSPASLIVDEEYYYSTGQIINNWDHKYKGLMSLRCALKESRNVPAYKLYMEVGMNRAHEFINLLGLKTDKIYESHAIGGFETGFSVLEMTNAYQAISNKGKYLKAKSISYIEINKEIVKENEVIMSAMKESTAFFLSSMMEDVIKYSLINIPNMRLSGKTGQTNYDQNTIKKFNIPSNATKDSWMIGFNNKKTIGVWVGYDYISSTTYLTSEKKDIAKDIFIKLMEDYNIYDNTPLEIPYNVIKENYIIEDNELYLKTINDLNYYSDYFIIGNSPSAYFYKNESEEENNEKNKENKDN